MNDQERQRIFEATDFHPFAEADLTPAEVRRIIDEGRENQVVKELTENKTQERGGRER